MLNQNKLHSPLNVKHFHPSTSRENFIQSLDHEVSKDAILLSKMFQGILNFEKKFNKEREEHDKKVIYFGCHKEGHTIHSCFLLFPHLKGTDGTNRQDRKDKIVKDGFKGRRKIKAMNAIWDVVLDDDNNDSDNEASHFQEANFSLMVMVEDILNGMDVETFIISKNITDPITIEFLRKIAESKKPKTQQSTMMCEQSTVQASLKQSSLDLQEEEVKMAPSTLTLEVVNGLTVSFSTSTALEEQLVSSPKVNYFANIPSDSDESDAEFDLCTISRPHFIGL
jgi:Zn-finger protein